MKHSMSDADEFGRYIGPEPNDDDDYGIYRRQAMRERIWRAVEALYYGAHTRPTEVPK
ncbi:MAG: hypothetical protein WBQ94_03610 [Terracidiphilus sp.]